MISFEEDRQEQRYSFVRAVDATLGRSPIVLCNVGESGVHARHATALRPGTEAALRVDLSDAGVLLHAPAFVVWSRFERPGDLRPYHSGLLVPDSSGELRSAVARLCAAGLILPDDAPAAKTRSVAEPPRERARPVTTGSANGTQLPAGVVALVREARNRLNASPREMARWAERARVSFAGDGEPPHDRDEVLAVWQYLERAIEIGTIERLVKD